MDCSAYSFIENTGFLLLFPMKTTLQTFQWFYVLICVFFFFFFVSSESPSRFETTWLNVTEGQET